MRWGHSSAAQLHHCSSRQPASAWALGTAVVRWTVETVCAVVDNNDAASRPASNEEGIYTVLVTDLLLLWLAP